MVGGHLDTMNKELEEREAQRMLGAKARSK